MDNVTIQPIHRGDKIAKICTIWYYIFWAVFIVTMFWLFIGFTEK